MSTSILKVLPGKLDIKRHSPSILYIDYDNFVILEYDNSIMESTLEALYHATWKVP